jgi:hypothetical protein
VQTRSGTGPPAEAGGATTTVDKTAAAESVSAELMRKTNGRMV